MKYLLFIFSLIFFPVFSQTKSDPGKIDIVRDAWGVPHIFAKTDADVAYGLAWAHAEDDFKTIQQGFLLVSVEQRLILWFICSSAGNWLIVCMIGISPGNTKLYFRAIVME